MGDRRMKWHLIIRSAGGCNDSISDAEPARRIDLGDARH
jgi:hypothetical protein